MSEAVWPSGPRPRWTRSRSRRRPGNVAQRRVVLYGRERQVRPRHRHLVDVGIRRRRATEQALAQVREVPVGVAIRRDAFVDLHDMNCRPRQVQGRQLAQHDPRGAAAADGEHESTACIDSRHGVGGNDFGGPLRDRVGRFDDFDLHAGAGLRRVP